MNDFFEQVEGRNIKVYRTGVGKPILFLHGFICSPTLYQKLFDKLPGEIIGPEMYGMTNLYSHPKSIDEYTDLTLKLAQKLELTEFNVIGHSMGGAVAYQMQNELPELSRVCMMDPVHSVNYGLGGYIARTIYKGLRQFRGIPGGADARKLVAADIKSFTVNAARHPLLMLETVKNIVGFNYEHPFSRETLIAYAEDSEYFPRESLDMSLFGQDNINLIMLNSVGHDWPILMPNNPSLSKTMDEIVAFLV